MLLWQQTNQLRRTEWGDRFGGIMDGAPKCLAPLSARFNEIGAFSPAQSLIVRQVAQKEPSPFANFSTFPKPDVIYFAKEMEVCQPDSQFLLQFAANSFLGALAFIDAAAWWTVKDNSRKRISDFSNEKFSVAPEYAQGRLP